MIKLKCKDIDVHLDTFNHQLPLRIGPVQLYTVEADHVLQIHQNHY